MAGVNTEAVKSLDFIVKVVLWVILHISRIFLFRWLRCFSTNLQLVLLIAMGMVTSNSICLLHLKASHLIELSSLGFFFIYLLQLTTLLSGEKIPCTMVRAIVGLLGIICHWLPADTRPAFRSSEKKAAPGPQRPSHIESTI